MATDNKRLLVNVFTALIAVLVCFSALEISARVYLNHFAGEKNFTLFASLRQLKSKAGEDGQRSFKKSFHRYLGYYPTPNYRRGPNKHNSLGYRGDEIGAKKPEGECRIVCLGGSTTYSTGVADYRDSYPAALERELNGRGYPNVKVINAGCPGWSSWESLVNLEFRVLDLDPDMIIVYHGVNDVHPRLVWPPSVYRGDNSGRSLPTASNIFMPCIWEYSTLMRILMIRAGLINSHMNVNRTIDRRAETFYASDFDYQVRQHTYPAGIFKDVPAAEMLKINKPISFQRNIENIVTMAQARGIEVILPTFAASALFSDEPRSSSPEYLSAYREQNDVLRDIAGRTGAAFFDFAAVFPADKEYYQDGRHGNKEGGALKARLFAEFIIQKHLLQRKQS